MRNDFLSWLKESTNDLTTDFDPNMTTGYTKIKVNSPTDFNVQQSKIRAKKAMYDSLMRKGDMINAKDIYATLPANSKKSFLKANDVASVHEIKKI